MRRWHYCRNADCEYKTQKKSHLQEHLANKHGVGVVWHPCEEHGCDFTCKKPSHLIEHLANVHDVDVTWYDCGESGCGFRCKKQSHRTEHLANVHGIDEACIPCKHVGCDFTCKKQSHLTEHMANAHVVDVTWYACEQSECRYRCKKKSHLKEHLEGVHDIGEKVCEYCARNRNSSVRYEDPNCGSVHICRACFRTATGKSSRVEVVWSDFVDSTLGTEFLFGSDTSLRSLGGCSMRRPDKLYVAESWVEVDECDEHQHASGDYTCDERRLTEIYDEPSFQGKRMTVIRWNPDTYKAGKGEKRLTRKERLELFVALKKTLRARTAVEQLPRIEVFYMFYDMDNPLICQNLTRHFVNTTKDLQTIK